MADALLAAAIDMDPSRNGVGAMLAWRTLSQRKARCATQPAERRAMLTPSL
jgi:hypothetical protein